MFKMLNMRHLFLNRMISHEIPKAKIPNPDKPVHRSLMTKTANSFHIG